MDILEKRPSLLADASEKSGSTSGFKVDRVADAFVFAGFLVLSVFALAAVAVATPVVLAVSALAGLFARNGDGNHWRPASA